LKGTSFYSNYDNLEINEMKCPKCSFENREGAKFCLKCGNPMELRCSSCGKALPAEAVFCDECGHDLREPKEAPPIDFEQPQSYTPKFRVPLEGARI